MKTFHHPPKQTLTHFLTFDVEEWFQVGKFFDVIDRSTWPEQESRIVTDLQWILDTLDAHSEDRGLIRATFFVLGWVARRYPSLSREIVRRGHELASHGYSHSYVTDMTPKSFREDVYRSKSLLEDQTGKPVYGYRAPTFTITRHTLWALEILAELGFRYDSSIFPINRTRYGIPDFSRAPVDISLTGNKRIREFPMATLRLMNRNFPFGGGGYFRLLPLALTRLGLKMMTREEKPAVLYLHTWEFDPDHPVPGGLSRKSRFMHYVNISRVKGRFTYLLDNFRFQPLINAL